MTIHPTCRSRVSDLAWKYSTFFSISFQPLWLVTRLCPTLRRPPKSTYYHVPLWQGVGECPFWGTFNITWKSVCWRLYPQLCDGKGGHVPNPDNRIFHREIKQIHMVHQAIETILNQLEKPKGCGHSRRPPVNPAPRRPTFECSGGGPGCVARQSRGSW